jgi:hypothetical protein
VLILNRPREVLGVCYDALMEVPCERALAERHGLTKEQFIADHDGGIIVGVLVCGEIAGGISFEDGEVHLTIRRKFSGRWLRNFRAMMRIGFDAFGPVLKAYVQKENVVARRFVERVGGVYVEDLGIVMRYEIQQERMRYEQSRQKRK